MNRNKARGDRERKEKPNRGGNSGKASKLTSLRLLPEKNVRALMGTYLKKIYIYIYNKHLQKNQVARSHFKSGKETVPF